MGFTKLTYGYNQTLAQKLVPTAKTLIVSIASPLQPVEFILLGKSDFSVQYQTSQISSQHFFIQHKIQNNLKGTLRRQP